MEYRSHIPAKIQLCSCSRGQKSARTHYPLTARQASWLTPLELLFWRTSRAALSGASRPLLANLNVRHTRPMLHADLADTPLASFEPDIAAEVDSPGSRLREVLASFIPSLQQSAAFAALDEILEEFGVTAAAFDRGQVAVEIVRAIYRDTSHETNVRYIAAAALKRMGKDGRSYQAIGDEFGVTRACIHDHSRRIEDNTGLKCRSDKKASARAKSVKSASGRKRVRTAGVVRGKRGLFGNIFGCFRLRGV